MKKFVIAAFLLILPIVMMAQNSIRYRGDIGLQVYSGYYKIMGSRSWIPATIFYTTHGIEWEESLTVAAGLGLGPAWYVDIQSEPMQSVPLALLQLYAHLDYAFLRDNDLRPFVGVRSGYDFTYTSRDKLGGAPEVGLGVGIRLNERLEFSAWYQMQIPLQENGSPLGIIHYPSIGFAWRFGRTR